jgi:hypothetical protein
LTEVFSDHVLVLVLLLGVYLLGMYIAWYNVPCELSRAMTVSPVVI